MRAVIQRVHRASVRVAEKQVGSIAKGLLVFLGIGRGDTEVDAAYLAAKIVCLRAFEDDKGKMNLSLTDIQGQALVVSQFTLWGDCRKGRRPSFTDAAPPDKARTLYNNFIEQLRNRDITTATGAFREMMDVELVNDGPVTFLLDSHKQF